MSKKNTGKKVFVVILLIYLLLPIIGTILYSVAGKWDSTVLPQTLTGRYYVQIFTNPAFVASLLRSAEISIISALISTAIILPCVFLGLMRYRKLINVFEVLTMIPFVMPGVVLSIGLIQLFSALPGNLSGTVFVLLGAYFVITLPYTYQTIRNSFRSVNAKNMVEAAEVLGCSESKAFVKVVLPNVMTGVVSSLLLNISILFGDFVLVNLIVGSGFETVQIFLYQALKQNGQVPSAVVTVYMALIFVICLLAFFVTSRGNRRVRVKK